MYIYEYNIFFYFISSKIHYCTFKHIQIIV